MVEEDLITEEEFYKKKKGKIKKKPIAPRKRFPKIQPQNYTKEQTALRSFFGGHGEPMWGSGRDLPRVRGDMMKGFGLIKSGDREHETAGLFGL